MKRTKEIRENEADEEDEREEIKTGTELPEEYYHGLEDLPWNLNSLEKLLYISLPAWIQRALLCNLAEQFGIWTFHNNFLPCRLISYALLPYTLPPTTAISLLYRFLCWAKKFPHQALNAGREFKQEMILHLWFALAHLKGLLANRFLLLQIPAFVPALALFPAPWFCLPSLSLTSLPCFPLLSLALRFLPRRHATSTPKKQSECRSQTQPVWSRQRSFLCLQLTGSGAFCRKADSITSDAKQQSSAFLLKLNLELEMGLFHPETRIGCEKSLSLNLDKHRYTVEENLSSPCISYMDVQEEDC